MVRKLSEKYGYEHKSPFLQKNQHYYLNLKIILTLHTKNKIKNRIIQKCLFTGPIPLISTLSYLLKCIRF